jgi:CRISPR type I-E-associated protein CasB/Cse2
MKSGEIVDSEAKKLVGFLNSASSNSRQMAKLKGGLNDSTRFDAEILLLGYGMENQCQDFLKTRKDCAICTAAAFTFIDAHSPRTGNFGNSMACWCRKSRPDERKAIDEWANRLWSSDRDLIYDGVIRIVRRMKGFVDALNYEQLFRDLVYWNPDRVGRRWACDYVTRRF